MTGHRKIIHLDCDCFYAAVEMRDDPTLRGKPVAVGGKPNQRGVVATCNYVARDYGVHSAMPTSQALRRCPQLILVPPSFGKYRRISRQIRAIFLRYTPLVEPLSLDEAYLDVTDCPYHDNSATRIAAAIRAEVKAETQLTISAGIAPNKFLAKVASDWQKPDGLFTISPDQIDDFVRELPVKRIFGVGPVTQQKMQAKGWETCGDLQALSRGVLIQHFGSFGERLYHLCRGQDDRPVQPTRRHKSISAENTFMQDLPDFADWLAALDELLPDLQRRWQALDDTYEKASLNVKVRYFDFTQSGRQSSQKPLSRSSFAQLLGDLWDKRPAPIRLLGVGVQLKDKEAPRQQELFPRDDTPPLV